jgi:hypothetical protein
VLIKTTPYRRASRFLNALLMLAVNPDVHVGVPLTESTGVLQPASGHVPAELCQLGDLYREARVCGSTRSCDRAELPHLLLVREHDRAGRGTCSCAVAMIASSAGDTAKTTRLGNSSIARRTARRGRDTCDDTANPASSHARLSNCRRCLETAQTMACRGRCRRLASRGRRGVARFIQAGCQHARSGGRIRPLRFLSATALGTSAWPVLDPVRGACAESDSRACEPSPASSPAGRRSDSC